MKKNSKKILFLLGIIILLGCFKRKAVGVGFYVGFKKDRVKVQYGNKVVLDSVLSTDASLGRAHAIELNYEGEKYLVITMNDSKLDSILINKNICGVSVSYVNMNLRIRKDSICKRRVFY